MNLIVASMPSADKFQLHIYAALAQQEREFISTRTKAALAGAKARGTKLGGARPNQQARHAAVKALALENANRVAPIIMNQIDGGKTYRYIADQLNGLAVPTARGGTWYAGTVRNYHKRLQNTPVA